MSDNRFKKVSKEEAEYNIALALLPFLLENGTRWSRQSRRL